MTRTESQSRTEHKDALIESCVGVLPVLTGAGLIAHFDLALTAREGVGLAVLTMAWFVILSGPRQRVPKGDLGWMAKMLGLGAVAAFGFGIYASYVLDDMQLFYQWAAVMAACIVSAQHVGMRTEVDYESG